MAKYRPIYVKIWKDPDFEEYPPDGKLIFIYLCTNPSATESGIYPISLTTISNETGVPLERVRELLSNGLKNVMYDQATRHVYVRRFHLYNPGGNPDLIEKSMTNDFLASQQTCLWQQFSLDYPSITSLVRVIGKGKGTVIDKEPLANGLPTVNQQFPQWLQILQGFKAFEVNNGWAQEIETEYPGIDLLATAKEFVDYWSERRKQIKSVKATWTNRLKFEAKRTVTNGQNGGHPAGLPGNRPRGAFSEVEG